MILKSFISNSMVYAIIEAMQKGVLFILMPLMTFYITPDEYGLISTALMVIAFLGAILTMSLHGAIARYYNLYSGTLQRAFLSSIFVFLTIFLCVILFFVLLVSPFIFDNFIPELEFNSYYIYIVIISFSQPIISLILSLLKIKQDVKSYTLISSLYFSMKVVFFIFFVFIYRLESKGYLLSLLISNVVITFISLIYVAKSIGVYFDFRFLKRALKYSIPMIPVSLLSLVNNLIDRAYILSYIGLSGVGIYYFGLQLSGIILMMLHAVNSAFTPIFYKLTSNKSNDLGMLYLIGDLFVVFSCSLFVFITLFGGFIIDAFFDAKYHEVIDVLPIISLSAGLTSVYLINTNLLSLNIKLVKMKTYIILFGAVVNCLLSWALTKSLGLIGAALSTLVSNVVIIAVFMVVVNRRTDFKYNNLVHLVIYFWGLFVVSIDYFYGDNSLNSSVIFFVIFIMFIIVYSFNRYFRFAVIK